MFLKRSNINRLIISSICLILIIAISGCEDVIEVDLNDAGPRLVIEAYILDNQPTSIGMVLITESTDFYQPNDFIRIPGAQVTISNEFGDTDTLPEMEPGIYTIPLVNTDSDSLITYTARVIVDGKTYSASASKPLPLAIDSVTAEYQEGGGFGSFEDEGYRLHVYFTDNPNYDDYGRIKLLRNDTLITDYYLYDGEFSDGNPINYEYFFEIFQVGDTVDISLYAMDETVYDYFFTLVNVDATGESSGQDAVPANPNTNWDNEALGYFGVYQTSRVLYVIEENP